MVEKNDSDVAFVICSMQATYQVLQKSFLWSIKNAIGSEFSP